MNQNPASESPKGAQRLVGAKLAGPSPRDFAPRLDPQPKPRPDAQAMENLEQRRLMSASQLPFSLDFSQDVSGTLTDADGQGTGFTGVQQNAAGDGHLASNLDLNTTAGLLSITTTGSSTTGSNVRGDDTLRNALAVEFDATTEFEVLARLVGENGSPLSQLNERYEQAGIMIGADSDHFVKLVALYHDSGPRLQFTDEWLGDDGSYTTSGDGLLYVGEWTSVTTLDLRLVADPAAGTVEAFYRVNGGQWKQTPNTITVPQQHRASTFSTAGQAGLVAFHRNNNGPMTVSFDKFEVQRVEEGPGMSPQVTAMRPGVDSSGVRRDTFVAVDLSLPNGAIDATTVSAATVYLTDTATGLSVPASVTVSGGGDALTLTPSVLLKANTVYTFNVTSGVEDVTGAAVEAFVGSFTTGSSVAQSDSRVAFDNTVQQSTVGIGWTGLTFGPEGKLYGTTSDGEIYRMAVAGDGSLGSPELLYSFQSSTGARRLITGLTFDTQAGTTTAYVSHGAWVDPATTGDPAPAWSGKITRFTGDNLQNQFDVIVGLARSVYDHLNNQPTFGPDGRLYFVLPSNTAMGAPDSTWGFRAERLMTGAVLAADVRSLNTTLDVKTEDGGTYNPYAPNAPVQIYATGIRNAYDMVFTSGGHLFIPTNGSAAGGNTPASPDNSVPAINGVTQTQHDLLFKVEQGNYYGHPNPLRGEYVLYGGNPTGAPDPLEVSQYPVGVTPPNNYGSFAYDFGLNVSPNGVIEYESNGTQFGGALDGKLLVVRYSGGDDVLILDVDHSTGEITGASSGSFGMTGMVDPLDLVQDPNTGNIYVAEAGFRTNGGDLSGLRISLLKPIAQTGDATVTSDRLRDGAAHFSAVTSTTSPTSLFTITNTGTGRLVFPADAVSIEGTGAARFRVVSAPANLSLQPGQSTTVQVVFEPTAKGIVSATLSVKSNDPGQPVQQFALRGLGTTGEGDQNEPSLQRILDLYQLPINVGDPDPETTEYPSQTVVDGSEEINAQTFVKAGSGNVTIEILASMGTANDNGKPDTSALSWYDPANAAALNQLFTIDKQFAQQVDVDVDGTLSFNPSGEFALAGTFYDFGDRVVYGEDSRNTWESDSGERRKVRIFPLKDKSGNVVPSAYVFTFEEYNLATDQNDIVGIIRNVQPAEQSVGLLAENLAGVPLEDRLIFNKIRDLDPIVPNQTRLQNTVRLTNTTGSPIDLTSITIDSADFTIVSGGATGTLAAGESRDVVVRFVYENPTGLRVRLRYGTLTIDSTDPNAPRQTFELAGLWQSDSENGDNPNSQEANLAELMMIFGYDIDAGPNTGMGDGNTGANTGGDRIRVGEEILSSYWTKASGSSNVEIVQLAAFHQQRDPLWNGSGTPRYYPNTTFFWHLASDSVGGETYNRLFRHQLEYGQALLPNLENSSQIAGATFDPGSAIIGFAIDRSWHSDPARNEANGGEALEHSMRWYAAKDQDGNIIPNTYLVAQDNVGTSYSNYDYQDNVYLVRGVRPIEGALAPDNAEATGSTGGIALTWDASTEGNVTGYHIERASVAGGPYTRLTGSPVTSPAYNDTAAPAGQTSYYRIVPVDYHGTEGTAAAASAARPAGTGLPAQPTGLAASNVAFDQVTLSWTDNANNETGYRVERALGNGAFASVATLSANAQTWTDFSVADGTIYRYRVFAVNGAGDSPASNVVSVTTPDDPSNIDAPTDLEATAVFFNRVELAWTDASDNETGFRVQRRIGAGPWLTLEDLAAGSESFVDTTVEPDSSYDYRVYAFNDLATSDPSNTVSVTTPGDPADIAAPTGLAAGSVQFDGVTLTWTDNSDNETNFRIERADAQSGFFTVGTVGGNVETFSDSTVDPETTYRYRVVAFNDSGESDPSNEIEVTTPGDPGDVNAPAGLTAAATYEQVTLDWVDQSDNETGFRIERATGAGDFASVGTVTAGQTSFTDATVASRTAYRYRVIAFNTLGESNPSNVVDVTTPRNPGDVAAPANLRLTGLDAFRVSIAWNDASDNETGFRIERVTGSGDFETIATLAANKTFYGDVMVMEETGYRYRVIAFNSFGESPASNVLSVTTPTDPRNIVPPNSLAAIAPTDTQVNLTWNDRADNETRLIIQRRTGTGDWTRVALVGADAESFIDVGVVGDTTYEYRVAAANGLVQSDWSETTSVTTPASDAFTSSNIGSAGGATSRVRNDFTLTGTNGDVGGTADSLRFVHQLRTGNFDVVVNLVDFDKADPASAAGIMVRDGLGAGSLNVFLRASGQTRLTFRDTAGGDTGGIGMANTGIPVWLRLQRQGDTFIGLSSADGVTWTEIGRTTIDMAAGLRLGLAVASYSSGESVATFEDFGDFTTGAPAAPTGLALEDQVGSVRLTWVDNAATEADYLVQRRTPGGSWQTLATLAPDADAFVDATTAPATAYDYRVVASNTRGAATSNIVSLTTVDDRPGEPDMGDGSAENRPGQRGVNLSWNTASGDVAEYRVERRLPGGTWQSLARVASTATALRDLSAEPDTTYEYRVVAVGFAGDSTPSGSFTVTTAAGVSLNPPTLSTAIETTTTARLNWNDVSNGETGYTLQQRLPGGSWQTMRSLPANSMSVVLRNLPAGLTREFRLRAETNDSVGPWSNAVSITTPQRQALVQTDIGEAGGSVTVLKQDVHYDITAGGRDVWGFEDELQFIGRTVEGEFDFAVRVIDLSGDDIERMAGMMARSSLDAASANVFLKRRSGDVRLTAREADFNQTAVVGSRDGTQVNQWLRLRRYDDTIVGYASSDGTTWTEIGRTVVALGDEVYVGLAVSAHSEDGSATARFRDLKNLRVTEQLPSNPVDLVAVGTASGVGLMWADTTGGRARFVIQRQRLGRAWETLAFVDEQVTQYVDETAKEDLTYRYRVASVTSAGTSPSVQSNPVTRD